MHSLHRVKPFDAKLRGSTSLYRALYPGKGPRRNFLQSLTFRLDSPRHNSQRRHRANEDIPVSLARVARVDDTRARIKGNGDLVRSQWALYASNADKVNRQARRSARPTTPATASLWIGCAANRKPVIAWPRLFLSGKTCKTWKILGESLNNGTRIVRLFFIVLGTEAVRFLTQFLRSRTMDQLFYGKWE